MDLDSAQQRVLGCLIEKRRTTPDGYPLSLNALRLACNQSTNRDPVMQLTDEDVREAATGLHRLGLARIAAAGQGARTTKYRHTAEEGLPASDEELAILAVLLVRGPQTKGELRTRTERLHPFSSLDEIGDTLDSLGMRGLIELLDREPGHKEARYAHRLGHRDDPEVAAAVAQAAAEHRARLIAEGRLPAPTDDGDGDAGGEGAGDGPATAPPAPATPDGGPSGAAASADASVAVTGPTTEALLERIEALERRIDELEELIVS